MGTSSVIQSRDHVREPEKVQLNLSTYLLMVLESGVTGRVITRTTLPTVYDKCIKIHL